jgi:DNA invertase Pin-like site-specific DNA recombinase
LLATLFNVSEGRRLRLAETASTAAGKAMFQMMGVFAEFERSMIRERVNAGIARAKDAGIHCGRPPLAPELAEASVRHWLSPAVPAFG